jgi:hypothetical protein
MAGPIDNYELWSSTVILDTGDTSKTIVAVPSGTRKRIVVTFIHCFSVIAAAQAVQAKIGTVVVADLPATWPVASEFFSGSLYKGLRGDAGAALVITPAAAGPRIHVIAEGYYET